MEQGSGYGKGRTRASPDEGPAGLARLRETFAGAEAAERYARRRFAGRSSTRRCEREKRLIGEALAAARPRALLDVACGPGRLFPLYGGIPVVAATDASLAMMQEAATREDRPPIHLVVGDATRLPLADRTFDCAVCVRLLHHLDAEGRGLVLAELARVARSFVIVSFFHALSLQHLRRAVRRLVERHPRPHRKAILLSTLREEAARAGLRVLSAWPVSRYVSEQWIVLMGKEE